MRVDIHVHTGKYSGCAVDTPEVIVEAAIAAGLDAIVLTEHDLSWPLGELNKLQARYPQILLLRGAEMTTREGEHILVMGIHDYSFLLPLLPGAKLIKDVQAQGGIAIYAHPWRWGHPPEDELLDLVDLVEMASTNIDGKTHGRIKETMDKLDIPGVVASDSHTGDTLGLYYIELTEQVDNEKELARAILSGKFINHADLDYGDRRKNEFYRGWKLVPLDD